jgi:hypothetical protein
MNRVVKDCTTCLYDEPFPPCKSCNRHSEWIKKPILDFKEVIDQNERLCRVLEELISVVEIQDGADDTTGDLYLALKIAEQELELNEKFNNERERERGEKWC